MFSNCSVRCCDAIPLFPVEYMSADATVCELQAKFVVTEADASFYSPLSEIGL